MKVSRTPYRAGISQWWSLKARFGASHDALEESDGQSLCAFMRFSSLMVNQLNLE